MPIGFARMKAAGFLVIIKGEKRTSFPAGDLYGQSVRAPSTQVAGPSQSDLLTAGHRGAECNAIGDIARKLSPDQHRSGRQRSSSIRHGHISGKRRLRHDPADPAYAVRSDLSISGFTSTRTALHRMPTFSLKAELLRADPEAASAFAAPTVNGDFL
ncbi:hypothetical protein N2603_38335 [Bradyrhizobium huanghuaihaiense]|uniref:hypothetical protein n=1 Tax=Bradyrhizobium huanghuaihaiense TaxID=990078 RepID=UPI0021AA251C|nr:hypothetical protein [Bradyrhizobium sp. CB3035]UWU75780.1 hypothetical protein N2603_38335 [Bradyrhizobium sp. CB3035]